MRAPEKFRSAFFCLVLRSRKNTPSHSLFFSPLSNETKASFCQQSVPSCNAISALWGTHNQTSSFCSTALSSPLPSLHCISLSSNSSFPFCFISKSRFSTSPTAAVTYCAQQPASSSSSASTASSAPSLPQSDNEQQHKNEIYFRGIHSQTVTPKVNFSATLSEIPILRQMDFEEQLLGDQKKLPFTAEQAKFMLTKMLEISVYDNVLYNIQRQGRISFYLTNSGEEAAQVGTGMAFPLDDILFPQYRELGALMCRGFSLDMILHQCFGTAQDCSMGRQMPVHYCNRELNVQCISSPVATQLLHAVGAGYALRRDNKQSCAVTYFGDGSASEGDFAVALNFSATLESQAIFICRNNGYAISTPVEEQYRGDGIAVRAAAYGVKCIRVDGNDIVACYNAAVEGRRICLEEKRPVLLELMTYRVGHHSTSDDSSCYRVPGEMQMWEDPVVSPISRFQKLLINLGIWTHDDTTELLKKTRAEILQKIKEVEKTLLPSITKGLFNDVYGGDEPWNIKEQKESFVSFMKKHKHNYDTHTYEKGEEEQF